MTKLILSSTNPSNKILTLDMYMILRKMNLKDNKILYISCDTLMQSLKHIVTLYWAFRFIAFFQ